MFRPALPSPTELQTIFSFYAENQTYEVFINEELVLEAFHSTENVHTNRWIHENTCTPKQSPIHERFWSGVCNPEHTDVFMILNGHQWTEWIN